MMEIWTPKEIRLYTGMKQEEFAQYTGIPLDTWSQWERGTRKPPVYVLKLLQRAVREDVESGRFGVDADPWTWDAGEPLKRIRS